VIRISVEVGRGAARYRVAAQSESIERALKIVERQNPGCEAKVAFPSTPRCSMSGTPLRLPGRSIKSKS
jgi:hypothetical protein